MKFPVSGIPFKLTYIVVTVLHEEGNAFAVDIIPSRGFQQPVAQAAYIAKQLAVPEGPLGGRVHHNGRVWVMARDCLEDR